jgi:hypothetical protein
VGLQVIVVESVSDDQHTSRLLDVIVGQIALLVEGGVVASPVFV